MNDENRRRRQAFGKIAKASALTVLAMGQYVDKGLISRALAQRKVNQAQELFGEGWSEIEKVGFFSAEFKDSVSQKAAQLQYKLAVLAVRR